MDITYTHPNIVDNHLTVSQLIDLLKKCPQDLKVNHEGCDCIGYADKVVVDTDFKGNTTVLITRSGSN